jgi:nitroreductase
MDIHQAIRTRRSIRRYTDRPVSREDLLRLVEAGCWAPTASNLQAWRFVILTRPDRLRALRVLAPGFIGRAPAAIVICQDVGHIEQRAGAAAVDFCAKMDSACAAQNIMLEAHGLGLGTCAVGSFEVGGLQDLLDLPEHVVPVLLIAVGYPKAQPAPPERHIEGSYYFEDYHE